jgi:glycosyltransferase involved in cell wall biosynthesis
MRVLYFTRDYTPHDHRFLSALASSGHEIYFLRLERREASDGEPGLPTGVEAISWRGGRAPARLSDGPALLFDLKRVVKRIHPDVVHAGPIQTSAFLTAAAGIHPLVAMSWGSDLLFDAERGAGWKWITRYTLQHTTVLVGDCMAVQEKAVKFGFPSERVVLFPWGVDLSRFKPGADGGWRARLGWEDRFVILSLRNWEPLYGVDIVVRAFGLAAHQNPDLRLILLGSGSQEKTLRGILQEAGVMERVHIGGRLTQEQLPEVYRAADLYVSASHSDGSSVSLLEALASGLPVLVSDIPGNREWITGEDDAPGWLFPDGDAEALARGLLRAADERPRLTAMKRAARCLAEARADWPSNFNKLLLAYLMAREIDARR